MTIDDLRKRVEAMRELGVMSWGDIVLGPKPNTAGPIEVDENARELRTAEQRHRTLFASVRNAPSLHGLKAAGEEPRIVVQRRKAQEHGNAEAGRKQG
jgi:hypothetical protein